MTTDSPTDTWTRDLQNRIVSTNEYAATSGFTSVGWENAEEMVMSYLRVLRKTTTETLSQGIRNFGRNSKRYLPQMHYRYANLLY
jgi:hypothetical protein